MRAPPTMARSIFVLLSAALLPMACVSVQDYGGSAAPDAGALEAVEAGVDPSLGAPQPNDARRWDWLNPAPTGRTLFGIGGTSESDVWVAGEAGTIAHFDGARWDLRRTGPENARYFAVGARARDDVWIAGEIDGRLEVEHFNGKDWGTSHPFVGAAFSAFSHGPGPRLFAVVDWSILELSPDGTWQKTDTSENSVFGAPADVWVASTGEAWAITTGTKLLRLPAGSRHWELQASLANVPTGSVGLAIAGAGAKLCAFYMGTSGGIGYLRYDGTWHVGPRSNAALTIDSVPHGARAGCLDDGSGILTYAGDVIVATETAAPAIESPSDFPGERLFGAWSLDGSKVHAVGTLGAFVTRSSGASTWHENGPTRRNDLLAVDVGLDGAMMAVNALGPNRDRGGETLFLRDDSLAPYTGSGIQGPRLPVDIAVIGAKDAWVLSNDNSMPGVTHWTGRWGITRMLGAGRVVPGRALAIWAPAKDDVWATSLSRVWHYDGASWTEIAAEGTYRSIHGTASSDVWFAGDGVAHWDGKALTKVSTLKGNFSGVWSSTPERVWLWGERAILFDGMTTVPVETALHASADWIVQGIAESSAGDVFVLTKKGVGSTLLWFDASRTRLVDVISSDLELTTIRGRGEQLWAVGSGGAALHFAPAKIH